MNLHELKHELDKTRYLLEQAKCNNAYLENELQGIRQQLCMLLGCSIYDPDLIVLKSRDGLTTVIKAPKPAYMNVKTALKPDLSRSFRATTDDLGPEIKYRTYERTSMTWANLPIYEEICE